MYQGGGWIHQARSFFIIAQLICILLPWNFVTINIFLFGIWCKKKIKNFRTLPGGDCFVNRCHNQFFCYFHQLFVTNFVDFPLALVDINYFQDNLGNFFRFLILFISIFFIRTSRFITNFRHLDDWDDLFDIVFLFYCFFILKILCLLCFQKVKVGQNMCTKLAN